MAGVVKGMEGAMRAMDLEKVNTNPFPFPPPPPIPTKLTHPFFPEKISAVMDKFETQFEDLDVATGYYETATTSATAVGTPQDDVDRLMNQVADEAGVELQQEMKGVDAGPVKDKAVTEEEREEGLGERLRALRN